MTRINCIPVEELCDEHLIAEYRELPRVFKLAKHCNGIPDSYRMGAGHVKFFYNKLAFISVRFDKLVYEMKSRGFNLDIKYLAYVRKIKDELCDSLWGTWVPSQKDMNINRARISVRLQFMKDKKNVYLHS